MKHPKLVIVTPALANANNGNWQTAQRWARLLGAAYRVRLCAQWAGGDEALMVALHARRCAAAVVDWKTRHPERPLVLVLTGTDLYHDIHVDPVAQRSLALADRLVVLNRLGARMLPAHLQHKVQVVLQSCSARATCPKSSQRLRVLMVGHLRAEKDPQTYFDAVRLLAAEPGLWFDHIGAALDPALGAAAQQLQAECPRYRWLGGLPHEATRRRIQRAHLLVHPSRLEGGAHVVIEAVRSGTPVLASRIDGNVGLLGDAYAGCFEPGDAADLAGQIKALWHDRMRLQALAAQAAERAPWFSPEQEAASLRALVGGLL
ncbi:MAG: selenoneine biosynthesis selenosugar synthase SenB [Hydrogenophaga sp.]|nr:selenoneine biosynthesis selenosugar synthase SenB [Hydrogenophaga sp.]